VPQTLKKCFALPIASAGDVIAGENDGVSALRAYQLRDARKIMAHIAAFDMNIGNLRDFETVECTRQAWQRDFDANNFNPVGFNPVPPPHRSHTQPASAQRQSCATAQKSAPRDFRRGTLGHTRHNLPRVARLVEARCLKMQKKRQRNSAACGKTDVWERVLNARPNASF
jgi:hypothetical protein